jgi:hypothetical protein
VYLSVGVGGGKAQIWIGAEAWVDMKEVAGAYRAAQRQIWGDDNHKIRAHHLEVFRFVRRQTRQDGSHPPWARLREMWNETHPEQPYKQQNGLFQAFNKSSRELTHPAE